MNYEVTGLFNVHVSVGSFNNYHMVFYVQNVDCYVLRIECIEKMTSNPKQSVG